MNGLSKIFFAVFLLISTPAFGAVAFVQSRSVNGDGSQVSSLSLAFNTGLTSGNTILTGGPCYTANCAGSVYSDNNANTHTRISPSCTNVNYFPIGYANNVNSGATTVTLTPTAAEYLSLVIAEFSGVADSSPQDGNSCGDNNLGVGNITTTAAGLRWVGLGPIQEASTLGAPAGYTQVWEDETFDNAPGIIAYRIGAAGSENATFSSTGTSYVVATGFALKEQTGAPSVAARRRILNTP